MTLAPLDESGNSPSWQAIFDRYEIAAHDFAAAPFPIAAAQIRRACQHFEHTSQKEVRILCKQDTRESRPQVFRDRGLFILPVKNGEYVIVKGEGYVDVPAITSPVQEYRSDFPFELESSRVGNSARQDLDRAYAMSLIRHFVGDDSLVLTIRERKFTARFDCAVNRFPLQVAGVQTEVVGGYEGENQVTLVAAKGGNAGNTIIRQLYYPFRQWQSHTTKPVSTLFFQRTGNNEYHIWHFVFDDPYDYNSIRLLRSGRYRLLRWG